MPFQTKRQPAAAWKSAVRPQEAMGGEASIEVHSHTARTRAKEDLTLPAV
jgi:hypothetical protein